MSESWRDALMRLHVAGWNSDDIDDAAEALSDACSDGDHAGASVDELTPAEVRDILTVDIDTRLATALLVVVTLRQQQTSEAGALRHALYDLDAFAYEYAGDA